MFLLFKASLLSSLFLNVKTSVGRNLRGDEAVYVWKSKHKKKPLVKNMNLLEKCTKNEELLQMVAGLDLQHYQRSLPFAKVPFFAFISRSRSMKSTNTFKLYLKIGRIIDMIISNKLFNLFNNRQLIKRSLLS